MKNLLLVVLFLFATINSMAQEENSPIKKTQKGYFQMDYLSINMPEFGIVNEPNMGFTGIHYNLQFNDFYTGVGLYGAVSGIRGGFFTLGVNAGLKKMISDRLFIDTGFHFGGGGGAGAPDGGGAFILPHANLGYEFDNFSLSAGYSYINFFDDGLIKNHQLNFGLQIPIDFEYANHSSSGKEYVNSELDNSSWNQETSPISVLMHLNNYYVLSETLGTTGEVLEGKTIQLAGFELAKYTDNNFLYFLKVDGAYRGIRAGYMNVFLGAGYQFSFNKNSTNLVGKFAIGAGGGGGVDTNGGFLISPEVSLEQKLFNSVFLTINGGYLTTPDAKFETATFGVGLKYNANLNGIFSNENQFSNSKFQGVEAIVVEDAYFDAARDFNYTENLYQISLQLNLNVTKNLFFAGQTSFANFGDAGAYAEGLVGIGLNTNPFFDSNLKVFAQILGGAAGGGGVSTGQGLIVKPALGLDYKLTNEFALRTSVGYVKTINGDLGSPFLNFGVKYNLSFLQSN
jgi:hypothetical protein